MTSGLDGISGGACYNRKFNQNRQDIKLNYRRQVFYNHSDIFVTAIALRRTSQARAHIFRMPAFAFLRQREAAMIDNHDLLSTSPTPMRPKRVALQKVCAALMAHVRLLAHDKFNARRQSKVYSTSFW